MFVSVQSLQSFQLNLHRSLLHTWRMRTKKSTGFPRWYKQCCSERLSFSLNLISWMTSGCLRIRSKTFSEIWSGLKRLTSTERWDMTTSSVIHNSKRSKTEGSYRRNSSPVARKRCAASISCGDILRLDSLSCLKAEKSLLFLLGSTFFLLRLSARRQNNYY